MFIPMYSYRSSNRKTVNWTMEPVLQGTLKPEATERSPLPRGSPINEHARVATVPRVNFELRTLAQPVVHAEDDGTATAHFRFAARSSREKRATSRAQPGQTWTETTRESKAALDLTLRPGEQILRESRVACHSKPMFIVCVIYWQRRRLAGGNINMNGLLRRMPWNYPCFNS